MNDHQTWEGSSNGNGDGYGDGYGDGSGDGDGYGWGNGDGDGGGDGGGRGDGNGNGWGYGNLYRLFPIPEEYYYLLKGHAFPQKVKICYDLYNASNQEAVDVLVEWYETVQDLDKANT